MKFAVATVGVIVVGMITSYVWLCWETAQNCKRRGYLCE